MKILNYLCVLIGLFVSCSKDGKLNSGTNPGKNAGDTIQCISATEITEYYIHYCGGDSGSVGELMQITQEPATGRDCS